MQHLELPTLNAPHLVDPEKARGFTFQVVKIGVAVAILGAFALMLAFFYQKPLTTAGFPYREVQAGSIVVVFAGWMIFNLSCGALGISTGKLSYNKLVAILRNEVETPLDIDLVMRRKTATALLRLNDQWTLYPSVFDDQAIRRVPMVLAGPGGVFAIDVVSTDPRNKFKFVDPAPRMIAGGIELGKRLRQPVKPVVVFFRHKKHYLNESPDLLKYTFQELLAYLDARSEVLDPVELATIKVSLMKLSGLPG